MILADGLASFRFINNYICDINQTE